MHLHRPKPRSLIGTLEALGALAVAAGVFEIYRPAGLIVAGVAAITFGVAAERSEIGDKDNDRAGRP